MANNKYLYFTIDVLSLGNSTHIDGRCLELQKKKKNEATRVKNIRVGAHTRRTKTPSGCPMLRKQKLQHEFKNEVYERGPLDIEDLANLGNLSVLRL
ncbi:hypothetical protein HN51_020744 [Arachis hypogaea]